MSQNLKKTSFSEEKNQLLLSLFSFKASLDKKINKPFCPKPSPAENFINIYKELPENPSSSHSNIQSTSHITNHFKPLKIKELDFFSNSELLLSNIEEIINKDLITTSNTILKVNTSESLHSNEEKKGEMENHEIQDICKIHDICKIVDNKENQKNGENQKNEENGIQENEGIEETKENLMNIGLSFHRNERLNSIDEKDESKEEDTLSKSSKERVCENYMIISEKDFERNQKENEMKKIEGKKEIPKFIFLDYKEFKNKSEHRERKNEGAETIKSEYSSSLSSIPNNSSLFMKKFHFFKFLV